MAAVAANCDPHTDEIFQRNANWSRRRYRRKQNGRCDDNRHWSGERETRHDWYWATLRQLCVRAKTPITPLCGKLKSNSLLMH